MQFDRQAQRARLAEDLACLRRREGNRFAECIDRVGKPAAGDFRQEDVADVGDIIVLATGELRRQRMRAKEARAYADAELRAERAGNAQHLQFAVQIQSIARLDLDGGDAIRQQGARARQ